MEAMMTHPFRRFIATLENVPRWFYAVAIPISLAWCLILGIIDNEADIGRPFLERYLDPLMWLWYGLPVLLAILWLMGIAIRYNHGLGLGMLWAIPAGCLFGTAIALGIFFVIFGFMRLMTGFA